MRWGLLERSIEEDIDIPSLRPLLPNSHDVLRPPSLCGPSITYYVAPGPRQENKMPMDEIIQCHKAKKK